LSDHHALQERLESFIHDTMALVRDSYLFQQGLGEERDPALLRPALERLRQHYAKDLQENSVHPLEGVDGVLQSLYQAMVISSLLYQRFAQRQEDALQDAVERVELMPMMDNMHQRVMQADAEQVAVGHADRVVMTNGMLGLLKDMQAMGLDTTVEMDGQTKDLMDVIRGRGFVE
jgi:hypothetical protein